MAQRVAAVGNRRQGRARFDQRGSGPYRLALASPCRVIHTNPQTTTASVTNRANINPNIAGL